MKSLIKTKSAGNKQLILVQHFVYILFSCSSSSLSWKGTWKRSTSDSQRKSASTCNWSCRTKVSERTPCSHLCPVTAAPAPAPDPPPTAPRHRTHRRPTGPAGTGTIAAPRSPIPLPHPPLPSYQRQRCRSVKIICKKEHVFNWGL